VPEMRPVLEAKGIVKRFPGVVALKGIDFDLYRGEVHAIVGQNGAGKSTFVKILNGIYTPDRGDIFINGEKAVIKKPVDAKRYGITLVHQEVTLVPHLSVAENIYLAKLPFERRPLAYLDKGEVENFAREYMEILGLKVNPWIKVRELSVGEQQLVQIARALAENARIICLDEPTSALTPVEVRRLFEVVKSLKEEERSIIFITHHVDEVFEIADRVTILRDGEKVATLNVCETNLHEVVKLMLGREPSEFYVIKEKVAYGDVEKPVLQVKDLTTKPVKARGVALKGVSFDLYRGEILGVAGLLGSGKTEVGKALYGVENVVSGEIIVEGRKAVIKSPLDAMRYGIYYLPENRRLEGLVLTLSVRENIVMSSIDRLARLLLRNMGLEKQIATQWIGRLNIVTPSTEARAANLSGGNQQKVVIAKALESKPKILIFDEPTMGIDIGAKVEVRKIISELARQGLSIILMSSDVDEILSLSDRVLVLYKGRQIAFLPNRDLGRDAVLRLMSGEEILK